MTSTENQTRLRTLTDEYLRLEHKLKLGGGPEKIAKIHSKGKLTALDRIDPDRGAFDGRRRRLQAGQEHRNQGDDDEPGHPKHDLLAFLALCD